MAEKNYWVRTEHGRVWGPYTLAALDRLRGQLTEKAEASLDGQNWRPGTDFPELRDLLQPARKIEKKAVESQGPRISKAIAEAFGLKDAPAAAVEEKPAQAEPPAPKPIAPPPPPVPRVDSTQELPASGDLAQVSPVRPYALAPS